MRKSVSILFIAIALSLSFAVFGAPVKEIPMNLNISGQPPQFYNVTLEDNVSAPLDEIDLSPGNFTRVYCTADVWDLDGFTDLDSAYGRIWDPDMTTYAGVDDNRWHYTNDTCDISEITGDPLLNARVNCTFHVWFYANYSDWNCTLTINDSTAFHVNGTDNSSINRLIAVDSPNQSIEWGYRAVNTEYDADVNVSVFNAGNVELDLQIDAYNSTSVGVPSNYSFDCQIGQIPTRGIVYNDTSGGTYATSTRLSNETYINVSDFDLGAQTTGFSPSNKSTYFGIYFDQYPTINGTCTGWMRFEGVDGTP
jgi:hypothetical protein